MGFKPPPGRRCEAGPSNRNHEGGVGTSPVVEWRSPRPRWTGSRGMSQGRDAGPAWGQMPRPTYSRRRYLPRFGSWRASPAVRRGKGRPLRPRVYRAPRRESRPWRGRVGGRVSTPSRSSARTGTPIGCSVARLGFGQGDGLRLRPDGAGMVCVSGRKFGMKSVTRHALGVGSGVGPRAKSDQLCPR